MLFIPFVQIPHPAYADDALSNTPTSTFTITPSPTVTQTATITPTAPPPPTTFSGATFVYDGDGKRVMSTVNDESILFVGGHFELNVTTGEVTKYYSAGASKVAMRKVLVPQYDTRTYLIGDHLGSTSLSTDAAGDLITETRYREASLWDKPWGEVRYTTQNSTLPTRYTYTGQYSYMDDSATDLGGAGFGLMFYNARWYDPALGRFAQADTTVPGGMQGLDRYAYSNNNSLKYVDPSGHDPILIAIIFIAAGSLILNACAPASSQAQIQSLIDNHEYQSAIDKTIELYNIDTHGVDPTFDLTEDSYGNTKPDGNGTVDENGLLTGGSVATTIGPAAFDSPSDLVDTIVHEAVHVEQFQNGRWYEPIDLDGDGFGDNVDGYYLNEVEAYDRVLERKDELELSDAVVEYDIRVRNNEYYDYLPDWLQKRVDQGNYTLP